MSQEEIIKFLDEHKTEWFTTSKIAKMTGVSRGCISHSLRKLRENYPEEIHWRNVLTNPNWYEYKSRKL